MGYTHHAEHSVARVGWLRAVGQGAYDRALVGIEERQRV